jgi:hypothetical protein
MDSIRSIRDDLGMTVLDDRIRVQPLEAASQERLAEVTGIRILVHVRLEVDDETAWSGLDRSHDLHQFATFTQGKIG